jgi:hypothetical protein
LRDSREDAKRRSCLKKPRSGRPQMSRYCASNSWTDRIRGKGELG